MRGKLRVVPLGGLGEIGKNMLLLEAGQSILVIDCGLMFPQEEMLGVDLVLPDITYLLEHKEQVKGIVITHGHEDHTGALPYVLPKLNVPVYATPLTHGLITVKLKEAKLLSKTRLHKVVPGDEVKMGDFRVGFFRVNHSIPDAVGLIIKSSLGTVVHSGDFKLDHTPVDGKPADFGTLARLGNEGVFLLLSDSTYVEKPGYTPSERVVGESLGRIMSEASGRVIVATFASHISRVQQVVDAAVRSGRRVFIIGKSMEDNSQMAMTLGYLSIPPGVLGKTGELAHLSPKQTAVVTTGTQGEPTSVLVRMANRDHRLLRVMRGDTIVMSATAIPGNEPVVNRTIDSLFKQGAEVLYQDISDVHVHGHGSQEELKMMLSLVRPRFFVPVHGEYRHLALHIKLAQRLGIPRERTFLLEDGDVLELGREAGRIVGKVPSGHVYVDGLKAGDVAHVVLRDRRLLADDGVVIVVLAMDRQTGKMVGRPDLISRGFVEPSEEAAILEKAREVVSRSLRRGDHPVDWGFVNAKVKDVLSQFLYQETRRRPLILPVQVEV